MSRGAYNLGSWCILRTASADTLRLVRSLTDAGLSVWTPLERKVGRMPRTRTRYPKEGALMPSYVFGRVEHLSELLRLAMLPHSDYPRFSVFQYQGGIPLIADEQLDALRDEEERQAGVVTRLFRRGRKLPPIEPGSEVKLPEGPFAGISGIVEGTEGQYTLVEIDVFGKSHTIKVASCLLLDDMVQGELPERAKAA